MKRTRLAAVLLTGALVALTPLSALAVGTPACTSIANTATVNYKVGTVDQAAVPGVATPFVVGNKVNLEVVVSDGSPGVTVFQGASGGVMEFTVTNTGNKVQDYALSTVNVTLGTAFGVVTDEFSAGAAVAYVESGATAGYQVGEDTATFIDELAPTDPPVTVYVVSAGPVPNTTNDGDNALYGLIATTHRGGTTGGAIGALVVNGETGACSEDTVFADISGTEGQDDGALDGADSDRSGLVVSASTTLTVSKTSAVYSDPITGTATPKAIPGAVVTYSILITNPSATTTATSVSISDSLDGEITGGHLTFGNNDATAPYGSSNGSFKDGDGTGATTDCTGAASQGIVIDDTCKTNAGPGGDNVDWNITGLNTVTITGLTLLPSTSTTIKFQVTIQ